MVIGTAIQDEKIAIFQHPVKPTIIPSVIMVLTRQQFGTVSQVLRSFFFTDVFE